ncbi:MAG TPA: hypothetical protein PKL84_17945, partial [Candidatus Hydrogenedentes bacterium]|nr:hypothetical protein [Candidatus Hydrogenedentota bacterium]
LEAEEIDEIIRAHGGAHLLPEKPKKEEEAASAPAKPRRPKKAAAAPEEIKAVPPGNIVPDTA